MVVWILIVWGICIYYMTCCLWRQKSYLKGDKPRQEKQTIGVFHHLHYIPDLISRTRPFNNTRNTLFCAQVSRIYRSVIASFSSLCTKVGESGKGVGGSWAVVDPAYGKIMLDLSKIKVVNSAVLFSNWYLILIYDQFCYTGEEAQAVIPIPLSAL